MQIRLKYKWRSERDVVCGAVIGPITRPEAVVIGLPVHGRLRIVGRSTALSPEAARRLGTKLREPLKEHPWPEEISETTMNRFSKDRGPVRLTLVEPLVVEISADVAWAGNSFRHPVRYLRARPELDPTEIEAP